MRLGRPVSLLLAVVTCLPLGWAFFRAAEPLWMPTETAMHRSIIERPEPIDLGFVGLLAALIFATIVLAYRLPNVDPEKRRIWVLLLFFGSLVAIPLFWYWHVFRDQSAQVPSGNL